MLRNVKDKWQPWALQKMKLYKQKSSVLIKNYMHLANAVHFVVKRKIKITFSDITCRTFLLRVVKARWHESFNSFGVDLKASNTFCWLFYKLKYVYKNKPRISLSTVLNDDQTSQFDKSWHDWTGASLIVADLAKVYPIRQIACYKGVNVVPVTIQYRRTSLYSKDRNRNKSLVYNEFAYKKTKDDYK